MRKIEKKEKEAAQKVKKVNVRNKKGGGGVGWKAEVEKKCLRYRELDESIPLKELYNRS